MLLSDAENYGLGSLINQRYEIDGKLGVGGQGAVFRAKDRKLNRVVVLKFIRSAVLQTTDESLPSLNVGQTGAHAYRVSPEEIERLKREALAAAALDHNHTVRVFDLDDDERGITSL